MKIDVSAEPYGDCRDALLQFRNANREAKVDAAYFDWRYRGRPNGRESIVVWARDRRGTDIGSLSLIPHHFRVRGRGGLVGVLGDISVLPEWRGKGVAQAMLQHLLGLEEVKGHAGCFVLPNEGAARALQKTGWRRVEEICRFVTPVDIAAAVGHRLPSAIGSVVTHAGNWTARVLRRRWTAGAASAYQCSMADDVDERFDDLWARTGECDIAIAARNREYLAWRYLRHPLERYCIAVLTMNGALTGYVVFRIQQRRCLIDDILWQPCEEDMRPLIACFAGWVGARFGVASVSLRIGAGALRHMSMLTHGWMRRPDTQLVMYRPNDAEGGSPDHGKWHVTAGDKDV